MNQEILNFSQMHAEPAWLSDLRQKAALEFENLELPNIQGKITFENVVFRYKVDQAPVIKKISFNKQICFSNKFS